MNTNAVRILAVGFLITLAAAAQVVAQSAPAKKNKKAKAPEIAAPECVGDVKSQLKCPPGTDLRVDARPDEKDWTVGCWVSDTPAGGLAVRQGPMAWVDAKTKSLRRWGVYQQRKSVGRWYEFFPNGKIQYIIEYNASGEYHGPYIECDDKGNLLGISEKANGKPAGLARRWTPDGKLDYAVDYKDGKMNPLTPEAAKKVAARPEAICAPKTCSIGVHAQK